MAEEREETEYELPRSSAKKRNAPAVRRRRPDAERPEAEVAGLAVEQRAEHAGRVEEILPQVDQVPQKVILVVHLQGFLAHDHGFGIPLFAHIKICKVGVGRITGTKFDGFLQSRLGRR